MPKRLIPGPHLVQRCSRLLSLTASSAPAAIESQRPTSNTGLDEADKARLLWGLAEPRGISVGADP